MREVAVFGRSYKDALVIGKRLLKAGFSQENLHLFYSVPLLDEKQRTRRRTTGGLESVSVRYGIPSSIPPCDIYFVVGNFPEHLSLLRRLPKEKTMIVSYSRELREVAEREGYGFITFEGNDFEDAAQHGAFTRHRQLKFELAH